MARSLTLLNPAWKFPPSARIKAATIAAIVIHVAGAIGILLQPDWFVRMTPVNLLLMLLLLLWTEENMSRSLFIFFGAAWMIGMATEMVGVNTGILFGNYTYGAVLGPRILGVPLIIGCNWFLTLRASSGIVSWIVGKLTAEGDHDQHHIDSRKLTWVLSAIGALLATFFDWVMEPVAVRLGYWTWLGDGSIPVLNYLTWFAVSWLLLAFAARLQLSDSNPFPSRLYIIQLLFFLTLLWGN